MGPAVCEMVNQAFVECSGYDETFVFSVGADTLSDTPRWTISLFLALRLPPP